ncbi:MAG: aminomethyl-transferring glycine dehydrogenase subunit GcvPA [Micavibrio aeruginosavorus]|uniref:Aminomethyl-transferring glycine dehydrogenase subunit GcvPA n=1 Tax=Micavibrio aeruginosavorus TaxID=349221 RepID=A0A2W5FIE1_9BACT|nr:MAG: aminomethyl-transferring glycine dehydrogenase subunit GcvPA [Micavibrio aeruginosavorus]
MRYLPLTKSNRADMLKAISVSHVDELFKDVPTQAMRKELADLPSFKSELDVERAMQAYALQNRAASAGPFFLGAGIYNHHIPASVDYIIQRSEFLTAYTPYQPEIAQGTLQVIFEFQSMIAQLTGQDIANASMYDGATSTAEAALMAMRLTGRRKIVLGTELNPQYREVLQSYLWNFDDAELAEGVPDDQTACVIVQSPDFLGTPHSCADFKAQCDAVGAKLVVVITEIVSLGMLPPPSEADIVCGEAQSIGLPMSFGGPHLGFFACKEEYLRQMPGRLCGQTNDADGKPGFVLTLSTREQHIRREKATSNICTNQGLCALAFTVHMALLGESGFKNLAQLNHERACALADTLGAAGFEIENENFFNEFVVILKIPAKDAIKKLTQKNIIGGYALDGNRLLVCATEMTMDSDIKLFVEALS